MTIPRPRLTVRRMMILVALAGLAAWPAANAFRLLDDGRGRFLVHVWDCSLGDEPAWISSRHPAPYWPRFWRCLLGRPWPGSYVCRCDSGRMRTAGDVATYGASGATEAADSDEDRASAAGAIRVMERARPAAARR